MYDAFGDLALRETLPEREPVRKNMTNFIPTGKKSFSIVPEPANDTEAVQPESTTPRVSIKPQQLGALSFRRRYRIKYSYLAGAMYKGISSKELVVAMGRAGLLGFLGTGGRSLNEIAQDIEFIRDHLDSGQGYGMNLICNLDDPEVEMDTVELYLRHKIDCVEAAAFMRMTPALVYYRVSGLQRDHHGRIECRNRIIAKVSRPEVAQAYLDPPPADLVRRLVQEGRISDEQAEMAAQVAMCDDICVEADSGGHTDQGVATVLLPTIQRLKRRVECVRHSHHPVHVGLSGGIGTPEAAAAAFMMGADFILTGSINQCTVEAGISDCVKDLLQDINIQDTAYAPAGDMFELGAKVQVLKKRVFFPSRANKLFMLYSLYDSWEEIPANIRTQLEAKYFRRSFAEVWREVQDYHRKKGQQAKLEKAESNSKHKLALGFRWYFAHSTKLAFAGDERNQVDFQIHTGPALGAFNQWVKGTELESWRERHVHEIAEHLMRGTADFLNGQMNKMM